MEYYVYLLSGLLLLGFINQGLGMPTSTSPSYEDMQGDDDYSYLDEHDPVSDKTLVASPKSIIPASLRVQMAKKVFVLGENAILECPVVNRSERNVILWYHEKKLLTNHHSILQHRYKLENNTTSYSLIINDIKMEDAGDYYCEVQPEKLRYQVSVNVLVKGAVVPQQASSSQNENSMTDEGKSSVGCLHISYPILMSSVFGMLLFLRI